MFENVVIDNLTWLLGDYVVGLDREKVKVAVWNGKLRLNDLELREEALSLLLESFGLDIPLHVSCSSVQELVIEIPWKQLQKKPVIAKLSNIVVLAKPQREQGLESFEKGRTRLRMARLHADETIRDVNWQAKMNTGKRRKGVPSGLSRLKNKVSSKLFQTMGANLQLEFSKAFLRLEDSISATENPFHLHLNFEELTVRPTDATWAPLVRSENEVPEINFSLVEVKGLEASLSCLKQQLESTCDSMEEVRQRLLKLLEGRSNRVRIHDDYPLIAPVNATLRISKLNARHLTAAKLQQYLQSRPLVTIDAIIPRMDISLDQFQYERLWQLSNEIVSLTRKGRFAFRPKSGREWWELGVERILPGFHSRYEALKRGEPQQMRKWRLNMKLYNSARKPFLESKREGKKAHPEVLDVMKRMEMKLPVEDIILYRDICDQEMESMQPKAEQQQFEKDSPVRSSNSQRLFSSFWQKSSGIPSSSSGVPEPEGAPSKGIGLRGTLGLSEIQKFQIDAEGQKIDTGQTRDGDNITQGAAEPHVDDDVVKETETQDEESVFIGEDINPAFLHGVERRRIKILVERGSFALHSGGGEDLRVPFLDTRVQELRVSVLLSSLENIQVEATLGTMEAWDLSKQKIVLSPRDYDSQKPLVPSRSMQAKEWFPEIIDSVSHVVGEKSGTGRSRETRDVVAAVRFLQREVEECQGKVMKIDLQSGVCGFELVLDLSSNWAPLFFGFWKPPQETEDVLDALSDATALRLAGFRRKLEAAFGTKQDPVNVELLFQANRLLVCGEREEDPAMRMDLGTLLVNTERTQVLRVVDELTIRYAMYKASLSEISASVFAKTTESDGHELLHAVSFAMEFDILQDPTLVAQVVDQEERETLHKIRARGDWPEVLLDVSQETYWHLLRIANAWFSSPFRHEQARGGTGYASVIGRQIDRRTEERQQRRRQSGLPVLSAQWSLSALQFQFWRKDQALMKFRVNKVTAELEDNPVNMKGHILLKSFTLVDLIERENQQTPRRIVQAGEDDLPANHIMNDVFTQINFVYVYELKEQMIEFQCTTLRIVVPREFILHMAHFFYEDPSGESFVDPFASAGISAVEAARKLKDGAKEVVTLSTGIVKKRGFLHLHASIGGVEVLLTSDSDGDLAHLGLKACDTRMEMFTTSSFNAKGEISSLSVQNLSTNVPDHRNVVEYLMDGTSKDSWQVVVPENEAEMIQVMGNFRSLRIIHTNKFFSLLRNYGRTMRREFTAIASVGGEFKLADVLTDEIESSKKVIPKFTLVVRSKSALALRLSGKLLRALKPGWNSENFCSFASFGSLAPENRQLDFSDVNVMFPRNSFCADEGVFFDVRHLWIHNHPASEGYNFAFDIGASDLAMYVLYPHPDYKTIGLSEILRQGYCCPSMQNAKLHLKIDWWRENLENVDIDFPSELDEVDPHDRLPAFRLRLTAPEGMDMKFCEAQYTVMYCVISENFNEPTVEKKEELSSRADAEVQFAEEKEYPRETPFLQCFFELSNLGLQISRGADLRDEDNVFRAEFSKIGGRVSSWPEQYQESSVVGVLSHLEDIREGSNRERVVIEQKGSLSNDALFKFTAMQPYMGKLVMDLSASQVLVVVVPELVVEVSLLNSPFLPYLPSTKPVSETPYAGLKLTFSLPNFEVTLFAEQTAEDRRSVLLRGGLNLMSDDASPDLVRKIEIVSKGLQVFLSDGLLPENTPSEESEPLSEALASHKTPLLFPTDLTIEVDMLKDNRILLSVSAESILLRTAVEDANLLLAVMNRMVRGFSAREAVPREDWLPERSPVKLFLGVQETRILVTSEATDRYLPILEAEFRKSTVRAQLPEAFHFATDLSISLFDENKGWWVPGMEPSHLEVTSRVSRGDHSVLILSDREVSFNVTPVTIKGALRVLKVMKNAVQDINRAEIEDTGVKNIDRPSIAAFCVRNETGLPVRMWHFNGESVVLLHSGEEHHAMIAKSQLFVSERGDSDVRAERLRCAMVVEGFKAMVVSVAEEGLQIVKLEKERGDGLVELCPMTWEVAMRDGLPVGTARSLYRIENKIQRQIEVKTSSDGQASTEIKVLMPSEAWNVPMALTEADFRVRPVLGANEYCAWSKGFRMPQLLALSMAESSDRSADLSDSTNAVDGPVSNWNLKKLENEDSSGAVIRQKKSTLSCQRKGAGDAFFFVLKRIVRHSNESSMVGFSRQLLDVLICPPLHVLNLLPRPVLVEIAPTVEKAMSPRTGKDSSTNQERLYPLGRCCLHETEGDLDKLSMRVAFSNNILESSINVQTAQFGEKISMKDSKKGMVQIPTYGSKRGDTPIMVDLKEDHDGLLLTLFAPYWIANQSDIDLEFQCWSESSLANDGLSGSTLLRACPPTQRSDDFLAFKGPYVSIRHAGGNRYEGQSLNLSSLRDGVIELNLSNSSLLLLVGLQGEKSRNTHILRIVNAMWIENLADKKLEWCDSSAMSKRGLVPINRLKVLKPGELMPVHTKDSSLESKIFVRIATDDGKSDWFWSHPVPVNLDDVLPVKMYNPKTGEQYIASARTKLVGTQISKLSIFPEDMQRPPYLIRNRCSKRLVAFYQSGITERPWLLHPGRSTRYSWDFPRAEDGKALALQVQVVEDGKTASSSNPQKNSFEISIDQVTEPWTPCAELADFYASVHVENTSKVVSFADEEEAMADVQKAEDEIEQEARGSAPDSVPMLAWDEFIAQGFSAFSRDESLRFRKRLSLMSTTESPGRDDEGTHVLGTSEPGVDHTKVIAGGKATRIVIALPRIGLSVVDLQPAEIMFVRASNLVFISRALGTVSKLTFDLTLEDLQIDNQLLRARNHDILYSAVGVTKDGMEGKASTDRGDRSSTGRSRRAMRRVPSASVEADDGLEESKEETNELPKPFLEVTLSCRLDWRRLTVEVIDELRVALQKVNLRVDDETFTSLRQFVFAVLDIDHEIDFGASLDAIRGELNDLTVKDDDELSWRCLYIKHLSIEATQRATTFGIHSRLFSFARSMVAMLGNIEDADFQLKRLEMEHSFATWGGLQNLIINFYLEQLKSQMFKLLTSSNLLSRPAAMIDMIATSAHGLFGETRRTRSKPENDEAQDVNMMTRRNSASSLDGNGGDLNRLKRGSSGHLRSTSAPSTPKATRDSVRQREISRSLEADDLVVLEHSLEQKTNPAGTRPVADSSAESTKELDAAATRDEIVVLEEVLEPARDEDDKAKNISELLSHPVLDAFESSAGGIRRLVTIAMTDYTTVGKWMRPPRAFERHRIVRYDLHRSFAQFVFSSLGFQEPVIGWVFLTKEQPDEDGLWAIWKDVREYLKKEDKTDMAELEKDRKTPKIVLAMVSPFRVVLARVTMRLVWSCPIDTIDALKRSEEDEDVLLVEVRPNQSSDKTFWPAIVCGSSKSRDAFFDLITNIKSIRNRLQDDILFGPKTKENMHAVKVQASISENDALREVLSLTENAPLRDPDAYRSVQVILVNNTEMKLILDKVELKSGEWRREPPRSLGPRSVEFCEADSGKEMTSDVHGSILYSEDGNAAMKFRFTFVNLFLAPNSFFSRGPPGISIRTDEHRESEDHVLISCNIDTADNNIQS